MHGDLRIVPSCELAALGPREGEAVVYPWRFWYGLPGLALWIALLAALIVPRQNRTPRSLPILIPVLIVWLLWVWARQAANLPSSVSGAFGTMVLSVTIGMALFWLMGHWLTARSGWVVLLKAFLVGAAVALLGALSLGWGASDLVVQVVLVVYALVSVAIVSFAMAGRFCRVRYGPIRFTLSLAVFMLLGAVAVFVALFLAIALLMEGMPDDLGAVLLQVLLVGLIFGGGLFVVSLLFLAIGLRSRLFRPRLFACLYLPSDPHVSTVAEARRQE